MSVKLMTTEQIQTNLATIANMWPGGIPPEQNDNINALKAELKRRGVALQAVPPAMPQTAKPIGEMTADQLAKELQKLSEAIGKDPSNEELQEQFANVRYQLRNKMKQEQQVVAPPKTGAFDPVTGETDMQKAAKPNGHVAPNFGQGVPSDQQEQEAAQSRILQAQAARARDMEAQMQMIRKANLAKCASDVAAQVLRAIDIGDVDGDMVEEACNLGIRVAETIFAKVGL